MKDLAKDFEAVKALMEAQVVLNDDAYRADLVSFGKDFVYVNFVPKVNPNIIVKLKRH